MKLDMYAIAGDASGRALRGALALLLVFALSRVAINWRVGGNEEPATGRSSNPDSRPAEYAMAEGAGGDEEDDQSEVQEPTSDWEVAHAAAESGHLPKLRFLIPKRGLHVEAEDNHAMTLLQVASRRGHLEIVKFLIDNGAAVNAVEIDKRAALHFAIIRRHVSVIPFLLEHGADVALRKTLGLTPLHVVVQSWRTELIQVLLDHGGDIEAPDDRGDTPLDWAITSGSRAMVQALLERGTLLRSRDANGKTPMERAVKNWDLLKVDVLARKGQPFPTNPKDMQRVMMLYAMKQGQEKNKATESSSSAEAKVVFQSTLRVLKDHLSSNLLSSSWILRRSKCQA